MRDLGNNLDKEIGSWKEITSVLNKETNISNKWDIEIFWMILFILICMFIMILWINCITGIIIVTTHALMSESKLESIFTLKTSKHVEVFGSIIHVVNDVSDFQKR